MEKVCCNRCGTVIAERDGNSIRVSYTGIVIDIIGSALIKCSCGKSFRKSAGFLRILPLIEKWIKNGPARSRVIE